MKHARLTALALAGAMTLSLLCACGGGKPEPTPEATVESTLAAESEAPEESVQVTETAEPEETVEATAEATAQATLTPSAIPEPTKAPETAKPTAEPTEAPAEKVPTASEVMAKVSAVAGGNAMSDVSFALEDFYNLSESDLEDYVLYMPDMSTAIEEIFVARVKDGKLDSVKSACQSRQKGMAEEAAFYATTGAYVDSYKLVTNGNWLLFCVCENAGKAVNAFNDCTK